MRLFAQSIRDRAGYNDEIVCRAENLPASHSWVQPVSLGVPVASAQIVAGVCTQTPEPPTDTRPRLLLTHRFRGLSTDPGHDFLGAAKFSGGTAVSAQVVAGI